MRTLIIIESPKKIKTIKKYLGQDYTILATGGHFRELNDAINGNGIGNDFEPVYKTIDKKQEIVNRINEQAKIANQILIATDPDREGEAIGWHVYNVLNQAFKNKVKRITFNEITKDAILEAINNPKTINLDLVNAQKARQCIDKKLGYDASKFLWEYFYKQNKSKKGQKLSAGRVQSVVLLLSNEREKEIKNFKSNSKFKVANTIEIKFNDNSEKLTLELENQNNEFVSKHELINQFGEDLINDINFELQEVALGKEINLPALKPFRTIDALELINKKLNIGLKEAQEILQKLYEGVNVDNEALALITYPRTDSYTVSDKFINEAKNYIKQNYNSEILRDFKQFKNSDSAQEGHECLRVVNLEISPNFLSGKIDENLFKVYELIYQRSLAIFIKSPVRKNIDFKFISQKTKNVFVANTKILKEEGYFIFDQQDENTNKYEDYKNFENKNFSGLSETNIYEIATKAPSRFNQASLVHALEKMQIGRPSTYATMVSTNLEKGFVVEKNKGLIITELGQTIIQILTKAFVTLINVEFTKQMEFQLDKISKGEINYREYIRQFWIFFTTILENAKQKYLR